MLEISGKFHLIVVTQLDYCTEDKMQTFITLFVSQ